jgi:hypothetical protein
MGISGVPPTSKPWVKNEQIRGMSHEEYLVSLGGELFQTYASFKEEPRESSQRIFETVLSSSTVHLLVIQPIKISFEKRDSFLFFSFFYWVTWSATRANRITPAHVTSFRALFRADEGMHSHLTVLPVWLHVIHRQVVGLYHVLSSTRDLEHNYWQTSSEHFICDIQTSFRWLHQSRGGNHRLVVFRVLFHVQ